MNYIKHLTGFFEKLVEDTRLNPTHISMYLSLFQFWNLQRFRNPISISRGEVMRLSKIASKATYHKCMRELHEFGYLIYEPSYNPYRGSLITLINLENEPAQKSNKKRTKKQTRVKQVNEQVVGQVDSQVNEPSINNTQTIQTSKPIQTRESTKRKRTKSNFSPPSEDEVKVFFIEKGKVESDGERFFNHFESNGWLVGGKAKMKDWKAAARNWILNMQNFQSPNQKHSLHVNTDKNYSVPL